MGWSEGKGLKLCCVREREEAFLQLFDVDSCCSKWNLTQENKSLTKEYCKPQWGFIVAIPTPHQLLKLLVEQRVSSSNTAEMHIPKIPQRMQAAQRRQLRDY